MTSSPIQFVINFNPNNSFNKYKVTSVIAQSVSRRALRFGASLALAVLLSFGVQDQTRVDLGRSTTSATTNSATVRPMKLQAATRPTVGDVSIEIRFSTSRECSSNATTTATQATLAHRQTTAK